MSQLAKSMCDNIFSIAFHTWSSHTTLGLINSCLMSSFFMLSNDFFCYTNAANAYTIVSTISPNLLVVMVSNFIPS
jgi:hypothetical protein